MKHTRNTMSLLRRFLYEFKWFVDSAFRAFVQVFFLRFRLDEEEAKTIVLLSTDAIGDFVLRIPFVLMLERSFPHHSVFHIIRTDAYDSSNLFRSRVHIIPLNHELYRKSYFYRWRFLSELPFNQAKLVIYPVYSRSSVGDEIASLIRAKRKVAFSGDDLCMSEVLRLRNNSKFDALIECEPWLEESKKYKLIADIVDGMQESKEEYVLPQIPQDLEIRTMEILRGRFPHMGREYGIFFPTASNHLKQWTIEKVARCCDEIGSFTNWHMIICGTEMDKEYLSKISAKTSRPAQSISDFSLSEVAALIKHAQAVVSVDSAPAHLSIALRKPTVVLLGGGQYGRHFPANSELVRTVNHPLDCYRCNWKCRFPEAYCVTQIQVESVLNALQSLIASQKVA